MNEETNHPSLPYTLVQDLSEIIYYGREKWIQWVLMIQIGNSKFQYFLSSLMKSYLPEKEFLRYIINMSVHPVINILLPVLKNDDGLL